MNLRIDESEYLTGKEVRLMRIGDRGHLKTIMDREKLMQYKTCAACGHPFNLGDPVVLACGAWEGPAALIHESEAVFDSETNAYVERRCYQARKAV